MSNYMKIKIIIPLTIILSVAIAALFVWQGTSDKNKGTQNALSKVTLAMDWTPNTNHTGMYVAQTKGWYKDRGIDLEILPYSANVTATNLVSNNKADIGIGTTEDIVGENAKNHPVISIGAITTHNTSGFIVRADSGINSPKDLNGKVYGAYGSPLEGTVVSQVIKKDGGRGNFQNVMLNVQAMQALQSKKIDFVWAFEGWEVIQAKRDGLQTKFFPITAYGIPDGPNLSFIATQQNIEQKADTLQRFMSATAEGYEYARTHPKEAAQTLIDTTPKETFPDKEMVFESQTFLSAHYADNGRKWGVQDLKAWTDYPQFMLSSGVVTDDSGKPVSTLTFDKLFTNQFLE